MASRPITYVRVIEGSELTGHGQNRYKLVDVFHAPTNTWRSVRAVSDAAEAEEIRKYLTECFEAAANAARGGR